MYQAKDQGLQLKDSGAYDMDKRQDGVVLQKKCLAALL